MYIYKYMKVIFLDFDGPLNIMYHEWDTYGQVFHPEYIENLSYIIEKTGAKIVISSSWRSDGLDRIREMWNFRNYPGEIIDTTPKLLIPYKNGLMYFNQNEELPETIYTLARGNEIDFWLEKEAKRLNYIVEQYCIIDDDSDILFKQRNNFVQCSNNFDDIDNIDGYGLTKERAEEVVKILNTK